MPLTPPDSAAAALLATAAAADGRAVQNSPDENAAGALRPFLQVKKGGRRKSLSYLRVTCILRSPLSPPFCLSLSFTQTPH